LESFFPKTPCDSSDDKRGEEKCDGNLEKSEMSQKVIHQDAVPSTSLMSGATSIQSMSKFKFELKLPQYGGKKGNASNFFHQFSQLMDSQNISVIEWKPLLMQCLFKEAKSFYLTHSINNPTATSRDILMEMVKYFDDLPPSVEYAMFEQKFVQRPNEPVKTFYLRYLRKVQKLQAIKKFPMVSDLNYESTLISKFVARSCLWSCG
jgi:hypothetical protein